MTERPKRAAMAVAFLGATAALVGTASHLTHVDAQDRPTSAQAGAAPAEAASSPLSRLAIRRERLDNGLRVVLNPDPTVPTVAIAVYYDVGSRNEVRGRSGFAHLFEHMMFQGSANVQRGEHFSLIMNRGGSLNGTTSEDRTNYFETLPANELELGLFLESDRMRSLAVNEFNFDNQTQVVIQERQQSYENRPYALSFLRINELAYGDYWPYAHSTIGDTQDLVDAPLSAVQEFWQTYYSPSNAVLSIAGDFDPDQAMELVRRYFGNIPSREVPPYAPGDIAPQTAERTDTMQDMLADLPAFHVAYHIPQSREADHYPLEMLALALGDGESSRLYQELVKQRELVSEIYVATDDRRGPDLLSIFALVAEGHTGAEVRPFIYAAIERIAREGIPERELEKLRNRVRASFVFGLQSNLDRAKNLAEFEMYWGDAELIRAELDRYLAVTSDDIERVAGRYFAETNRTVLDVVPAPRAEESAEGGAR
ncbi:M16 family metallopeptidase [Sandaracinus amylolyticus]|uniref:Putative zinc protease n=1 Tax=Sandaracinus amylolyticus TaxID=927083 RepID=A0A0F6W601_9BACT|nr:pitrilysin family protein [Sandaracinus amylolyticus]AKF08152.1 putative zinc protease [Sandaracinus amylolyticus]